MNKVMVGDNSSQVFGLANQLPLKSTAPGISPRRAGRNDISEQLLFVFGHSILQAEGNG
jgi:hypothetical protein